MTCIHSTLLASSIFLASALPAGAVGIFAPAAGQPGSTAVAATSPTIVGWATGYQDYAPGSSVDLAFRTPLKALGAAGNSDGTNAGYTFDIVSLGNRGSITLTFGKPIANGAGADFAVFENSFSDTFLELARVDVSSDGVNFFAFPAFSLTPVAVAAFGSIDPTNVNGLAGKYRAGFGTPFDLATLAGTPGLDLGNVGYVRLRDVAGDGSDVNDLNPASLAASLGIPVENLPAVLAQIAAGAPGVIYDPYPTTGSVGFDLDAVGVINVATVPVPGTFWLLGSGLAWLARRRFSK